MFGLFKKEKTVERKEKFIQKTYKKEISTLQGMLTEGETIVLLTNGMKKDKSTTDGLIALTNKRFIFSKEGKYFSNVFEQFKLEKIDSISHEFDDLLFRKLIIQSGSVKHEYKVADKEMVDKIVQYIRNYNF